MFRLHGLYFATISEVALYMQVMRPSITECYSGNNVLNPTITKGE